MALNLEKQLILYGQYHHEPTNVAIHMGCVPFLLFTGFLILTNTPAFYPVPSWLSIPYLPPNLGTISAFAYSCLYILMEPVAGTLVTPILLGGTAFCNYLTSTYGALANYGAIGLHIAGWTAQFVGHGVFEKRAPALLDNLAQPLFLAPFFVWLEILFSLGYRPELKDRYNKGVEKEITKWKNEKAANGKVQNGKAN